MKRINLLVWAGLLANIIMLSIAFWVSSSFSTVAGELSYSERELARMLSFMVMPFGAVIAIQILSLLVLFKIPKLGLVLAVISSIIMLPLSIIFLVGYVISYEKHCNKDFDLYHNQSADISLNFKWHQFFMQGVLFTILGLFVGFLGVGIGWLVAIAGLVTLFNSFRLKKRIMIGGVQDEIILTPTLYSGTYLIPLSDVTLIREDNRLFKLHIKSASVDRKCTFRKGWIEGKDYQASLDKILSHIAKQEKK